MSSTDVFFSERNEAMLQRVLYNDICRRVGGDLNERQAGRLIKTVKHYMGEVYRVKGGSSNASVSVMNKEVLQVVLPDYLMYMNRVEKSSSRSVVSDIESGPGDFSNNNGGAGGERMAIMDRQQMDVSAAFSQLQDSRQVTKSKPPQVQDFRLSLNDEAPVSMDIFERMKQERESEAQRTASYLQQQQAMQRQRLSGSSQPTAGSQQSFAEATTAFAQGRRQAEEDAEAAFAEQERKRLEARAAAQPMALAVQPPPDMRALFMGDRQNLERRNPYAGGPSGITVTRGNEAAGNPTVLPQEMDRTGGLQQMIITREPEMMAYKESELNLFVYSGDRDWISNSQETRYNFTVNFDPANLPVGLRLSPTSTVKFKNIVRIELVKAILPGEGLDLLVAKSGAAAYDSSLNMNLLSYPYIQVRIPELDNNVYGTNLGLNAAFAVLQYDANWVSDTSSTQRGYFAMIPKFLKCQKVYQPTPLATLQKLSFRFERPDANLLSSIPDTLDISQIIPTFPMTTGNFGAVGALTNTNYKQDAAVDVNGSAYFWLKTSTYFNHWTVSKGDRIVIKNLSWASAATGNAIVQLQDFLNYIQQDAGLYVVDTGVITGTAPGSWVFSSGSTNSYNAQGYANAIIVRSKFQDPAITGGLLPTVFGGINDAYTSGNLSHYLTNTAVSTGRLLNQSHQVQVALRVITRELDPTGVLRPDNL